MNLVVIGVKMKNKKPSKKLLKAIKEGNDILNGKKIVKSYHNMYEISLHRYFRRKRNVW